MAEPLVSIIIPCFNGREFVGDAILSALAQTYSPKEIVVIDDGSTDGSIEIIKSFGDRIRWETGPNSGANAARNRGLNLARGDILQFVDADDLLAPDKVLLQVPLLLADKQTAVYCDATEANFDNSVVRVRSPRERDDFRICCFDRIGSSAPIHWKAAIRQVGGFDETLPCAQEFDLHLRLACSGFRFRHLPRSLVTYRRRAGSISSDYVRVLKHMGGVIHRAAALLHANRQDCSEELRALSEVLAQAAVHLLDRGYIAWSNDYLRLARALHPSGGMGIFGPLRRTAYKALGVEHAHPVLEQLARLRRRVTRTPQETDPLTAGVRG